MKRRTLVAAAGILAIAGSIPLSALAAALALSAFFFICASILPNASLNVSILI